MGAVSQGSIDNGLDIVCMLDGQVIVFCLALF